MAKPESYSVARAAIPVWMAGLLSLGACSALTPPTARSITGLSPAGTVNLDERFVAGFAEGRGTLGYEGQTYPFIIVGSVMGPGGGLSKIQAAGEVYKLSKVADFPGRYTQGTGPAGLSSPGSGDLWLQNSAGVIMHLKDTSTGEMLTLGRDEILVRMSQ